MKAIFELQNPWRSNLNYRFNVQKRDLLNELLENLPTRKILGLVGSRQVGKSSIVFLLIEHLFKKGISPKDIFYFNLDHFLLHDLFKDVTRLLDFIGISEATSKKYLFIDEVQRLDNPGLFLKELYDLNLNLKIIYSGSSQIEMKSKLKEHLVGRVRQLEVQRLSFGEYLKFRAPISKEEALKDYLIYGAYPEVALAKSIKEKKLLLQDIYKTYIEKDIAEFLKIENLDGFNRLLILLSNQMGHLLNVQGLSKSLSSTRKEVEKHLSILESTFIIRRIYPFYKNYKKEITKTPKIYFLDLGLRNLLINKFSELDLRDDQGQLFENFYLLQLLAKDPYGFLKIHFWRTLNQTEVDFIVRGEELFEATEVKWNKGAIPKSFATLKKYYPKINFRVVTRGKFLEEIDTNKKNLKSKIPSKNTRFSDDS